MPRLEWWTDEVQGKVAADAAVNQPRRQISQKEARLTRLDMTVAR